VSFRTVTLFTLRFLQIGFLLYHGRMQRAYIIDVLPKVFIGGGQGLFMMLNL
jgi:hypothetical protein